MAHYEIIMHNLDPITRETTYDVVATTTKEVYAKMLVEHLNKSCNIPNRYFIFKKINK
jgi:hypothetical protein